MPPASVLYILSSFCHIYLFIVLAYFIIYLPDAHLCLLLPCNNMFLHLALYVKRKNKNFFVVQIRLLLLCHSTYGVGLKFLYSTDDMLRKLPQLNCLFACVNKPAGPGCVFCLFVQCVHLICFILAWLIIPPKFEFISGMNGHLNLRGKFAKFRLYPAWFANSNLFWHDRHLKLSGNSCHTFFRLMAIMFLTHFECVRPGAILLFKIRKES